MHQSDEEHQGLLGEHQPQDPTKGGMVRFSSQSNWEEYNKKPTTPDQSGPSKFDAIVILILLLMIGLSGFGLLKHYNVIPDKPIEQGVRVAPAVPHQKDSVVQEVFNKISSGLQNIGQEVPDVKEANEADDLTIDSVLDNYLSKIEQYNDIQTEWVDDDDDVNKQIEEKLEEQQNIVEDLQDLIISQESEIQIIKPVFSKNIYTFRELQNGLRLLFIQSTSDGIQVTATLNMGTFNDPPEYPGLTELVFRCLQTNFLIEVYEHYTTLTAQLNLFEEINAKLQELHTILVKPVFLDINRNAQDLYDDLMQESKSGDLDYVSQFLNSQQKLQELSILQVEQDQLQQHYLSHISGDVLSIVFKSQEESDTILNKIFASDLITLKNLHKYQEPYYENNYPEGRFVLKFRGDNDVLTVLTVGEEVSNQRFLSYLLPKPFSGAIYLNHLLITLDVDLSGVVQAVNKFIQFLDFVKQSDEVQLQYLYSQMLATEELILNTKYDEDLTQIGKNLFKDPIYALKGEESLPIFDKEEFDLFVTELANNFIILVGSSSYQFDSTYVSQTDDSIFIQDAVINKLHQEFQYDLKPLVTQFEPNTEQQFSLPQISTFLPENLAIVSVCQEPVYKIQGFGTTIVDDLSKTVKEEKFDGLRDPKFETVEFTCEFPMPDFTKECQEKERAAQFSLAPYQIAKNVWWKPSKLGAMVFTGLFIEKPQSTLAQGKTLLKLLQKYYTELAKRQFQQEFLFGYELSFKETINGLSIQMLSYSEKQSEFQDKVFDLMATNDEQLFYYVKDLLNKDIRRFHDQKLSLLTQSYYLPKIMLRPVNTPQEILNVLDEVTYLTFEAFQKTLMGSKIQIMNIGNILPQESVFEDSQELYMTRTLSLKGQNLTYIVQRESNTDLTSAVLNYYQSGLRNIENAAKLHFYADFLQTYSTNYFSMGQQVLIKRKPLGCADGLQIYMQGEVPSKAQELIEQFLKQANLYLSNLQDEDLMESKLYTINKLYNEIKFKTLQEEGQFIWEKIVNKNYAFTEVQDVIRYLDEAFPQKLRECANLVMQGQVSVQVFGIQEDVVKSKDAILTVDELKGQDVYECFFTL